MQALLPHFLYFPVPIFFKYKCKEPTGFSPVVIYKTEIPSLILANKTSIIV